MENKEAIKLLDNVYSLIMDKINNKNSNKLYRISQVQNVLNMIDDLQNEIEQLEKNNIMTKEKQQRNKSIDFIVKFASDEIETINDALKIARMTNQELKENIKSTKEFYKTEEKTIYNYIHKYKN